MKTELKKAVLLVSFNEKHHSEENESLLMQEKEGTRYAEQNNIVIVRKWIVSKSLATRSFKELIKFVETQDDVNVILLEGLDELRRRPHTFVKIDDLRQKHSKELHFFKDRLVITSDPEVQNSFNYSLSLIICSQFVRDHAEETMRGIKAKYSLQ